MKKENITSSPAQTKKLGEKFAKEILNPVRDSGGREKAQKESISNGVKNKPKKKAFVVGLEGELGGGKTTFLQGFAKGLGIKEKILSPTFVIMKKINDFYHIDCYRIKKPKELLDLGFKEITSNPKNIIAVEWADKIKKILPKHTLWIKFDFINEKRRRVAFRNFQLCDTIKK